MAEHMLQTAALAEAAGADAEVVAAALLHDIGHYTSEIGASKHNLILQGGQMSAAEIERFRTRAYWRDAVQVRLWDDAAKIPGVRTKSFAEFRPVLEAAANGDRG